MLQLPGNGNELLLYNGNPVLEAVFPEIGCKVSARITKTTFTQISLQIFEVEGRRTQIEYNAVLRPTDFNPNECLCDKLGKGDVVECVVTSYGDVGIFVAL